MFVPQMSEVITPNDISWAAQVRKSKLVMLAWVVDRPMEAGVCVSSAVTLKVCDN